MSTSKTPNLHLNLPDYNISPWHDKVNENFSSLDAIIKSIFGIQGLLGGYKNSTAITQGQRYFDDSIGFYFEAQEDFTTMASPTTFAEERTAHPTRWATLNAAESIDAAQNAIDAAADALAAKVAAEASADIALSVEQSVETMEVQIINHASTAQGHAETAAADAIVATNAADVASEAADEVTTGLATYKPEDYVVKTGDTMTGTLAVAEQVIITKHSTDGAEGGQIKLKSSENSTFDTFLDSYNAGGNEQFRIIRENSADNSNETLLYINENGTINFPRHPNIMLKFGAIAPDNTISFVVVHSNRFTMPNAQTITVPEDGAYFIHLVYISDNSANSTLVQGHRNGVALGLEAYGFGVHGTGSAIGRFDLLKDDILTFTTNSSTASSHADTRYNKLYIYREH